MIQAIAYVNRATCDIINLKKKESMIFDRACELAKENDRYEKFLEKHYSHAYLLHCDVCKAASIYQDFFDECYAIAEKEFDENFAEKTFIIED